MVNLPGERREPKETAKKAIVDAMESLLIEKAKAGEPPEALIGELMGKAHIPQPAFYTLFSGEEAVISAVFGRFINGMSEALLTVLSVDPEEYQSPGQVTDDLVDVFDAYLSSQPAYRYIRLEGVSSRDDRKFDEEVDAILIRAISDYFLACGFIDDPSEESFAELMTYWRIADRRVLDAYRGLDGIGRTGVGSDKAVPDQIAIDRIKLLIRLGLEHESSAFRSKRGTSRKRSGSFRPKHTAGE